MGRKKPRFHCKTEAQRIAIRASYAKKAKENKAPPPPSKPPFKLPLKNGGRRWNIYRVPNYILNGKQDGNVHGGLVLDELNDNVMLVQVTHSEYKKRNRKNLLIRNLDSTDTDKKTGRLRNSYLEKRLVVSTKSQGVERGIASTVLGKQTNDLQFTEEEKQAILDELSNLSTAEEKYELFKKLAKEKADF